MTCHDCNHATGRHYAEGWPTNQYATILNGRLGRSQSWRTTGRVGCHGCKDSRHHGLSTATTSAQVPR